MSWRVLPGFLNIPYGFKSAIQGLNSLLYDLYALSQEEASLVFFK